MAVVLQTLVDSDFEHVVKVTTTGTTTAGSIADASELAGAATDPRMSISGIEWSVAATTQILWDATTNVVCFTCNGSGSYGFGDGAPSLANNAGSGITGDVLATHGTSVGTIIVRFRKVSGFDNIKKKINVAKPNALVTAPSTAALNALKKKNIKKIITDLLLKNGSLLNRKINSFFLSKKTQRKTSKLTNFYVTKLILPF